MGIFKEIDLNIELKEQNDNLNRQVLKLNAKKKMLEKLANERKEEIEKLKAKIRKLEEKKK